MIFWIASYPKSGNTWLRTLLASYFFSKDGFFSENLLENINQFPQKKYFEHFDYDKNTPTDTSRFWIKAQEKINQDKKIRFFKTHNIYGTLNNENFSNKFNSIGCLYIIRDPRNVITSLKNHYELNYNSSLDFMNSDTKYIYDTNNQNDYSDFQFISSWEKNYQSWLSQREIPVKLIKYEELQKSTFSVFKEIIEFIYSTIKKPHKFDKIKAKNAVSSTSFQKLSNYEKERGFKESVLSKSEKKKIPFFFLGPKNDWSKIIDEKFKAKINKNFEKNLKELNYN
jgi:hypothetical protein